MDEIAGPTAFDLSGNGYNGQFQPNTTFQVPGPESGSFGIASPVANGGVIRNGDPIFGGAAKSMLCWVAMQAGTSTGQRVMYEGDPTARGIGVSVNTTNLGSTFLFHTAFAAATGRTSTVGQWQLWAWTYDTPAGGTSTFQLDLGAVSTLTGHAPVPSLTGDPIAITTPDAATLAHFAAFNRKLSNADIQSVYNGAVGLQPGSTFTGRAAADYDFAFANDMLQKIYDAVFKTF